MEVEHRSQKTRIGLGVLAALLAAVPALAAELRYEVRHHSVLKDDHGVLTFGDAGVSYQPAGRRAQFRRVELAYQDIQQLWISADKVSLTTYQDRKFWPASEKRYDFALCEDGSFARAYELLKGKLDRRLVAALGGAEDAALWELPVKLRGSMRGSEGVLRAAQDGIVYRTAKAGQSRTWRYLDIDNVSSVDRYELTITTYERASAQYGGRKSFTFQLKQPLDEKRFDALWKRVNQDKGLQYLTSIEERNQNTK